VTWKQVARIYRRRWLQAEALAEKNIDRFLAAHEKNKSLEARVAELEAVVGGLRARTNEYPILSVLLPKEKPRP